MQPKWDSFSFCFPFLWLIGFFPSHRAVNQPWVICFDLIPELFGLTHPKARIHQLGVRTCETLPLSGQSPNFSGSWLEPPRDPLAIFFWSSLRRSLATQGSSLCHILVSQAIFDSCFCHGLHALPHKSSILFARLLSISFKHLDWPCSRPPRLLLLFFSLIFDQF